MVRRHAVVSGKVQGVGFRYRTRERARKLGLTGFARNMPDGTVEVEAEGPEDDVTALLDWLRQGPRGARVSTVEVTWAPIAGDASFDIIR